MCGQWRVCAIAVALSLLTTVGCPRDDGPQDAGCECIPEKEWDNAWRFQQTCFGCQVKWGCRHLPQTFHCDYNKPFTCYQTGVEPDSGCPMPELQRCSANCNPVRPDAGPPPPEDAGSED